MKRTPTIREACLCALAWWSGVITITSVPPPTANPLGALTWMIGLGAVTILAIQFGPALASWIPTKKTPAPKSATPAVQNPRRKRR